MKNAYLDEMQAGIKIMERNSNNFRYANYTIFMAKKWRGTKEPLGQGERWKKRVKNTDLKLNIQETQITASSPITSW